MRIISLLLLATSLLQVPALAQDITPPSLIDLILEPRVFDVSEGDATGTLTWHIRDDLSGVASFDASWRSPLGQTLHSHRGFDSLVSGDESDGTWQTDVALPRYSELGEWKPRSLRIFDRAGNVWTDPARLTPLRVIPEPPAWALAACCYPAAALLLLRPRRRWRSSRRK